MCIRQLGREHGKVCLAAACPVVSKCVKHIHILYLPAPQVLLLQFQVKSLHMVVVPHELKESQDKTSLEQCESSVSTASNQDESIL